MAKLANLADGTEARSLVRRLRQKLDARRSAFQVAEVGGGFRLLTRPALAPWLRRLHGAPPEIRLSGPAMETLAIVAYRQPVLRTEVEAIRGVQCGELLRQLMERDLLRIVGRSDELGRPFLYGTTKGFLQVFGLKDIDELPPLVGLPTASASETTIQMISPLDVQVDAHEERSTDDAFALDSENGKETIVDEHKEEYEDEYEFEDEDGDEYEYVDEDDDDEYEDDDDDEYEDEFEDEEEYEDEDEPDDEWEEVDDEDDEEYEDEEDDDEWDDDEYEYEDEDEEEE